MSERASGDRGPALLTAEDLREISSDDAHRYELDAGRLVIREAAGHRHGRVTAELYAPFVGYARVAPAGEVVRSRLVFS